MGIFDDNLDEKVSEVAWDWYYKNHRIKMMAGPIHIQDSNKHSVDFLTETQLQLHGFEELKNLLIVWTNHYKRAFFDLHSSGLIKNSDKMLTIEFGSDKVIGKLIQRYSVRLSAEIPNHGVGMKKLVYEELNRPANQIIFIKQQTE